MITTDWNSAIDYLTDNKAAGIKDEYILKAYDHITAGDFSIDLEKVTLLSLPEVRLFSNIGSRMPVFSSNANKVIAVALAYRTIDLINGRNGPRYDEIENVFNYILKLDMLEIAIFSKVLFSDLNCQLKDIRHLNAVDTYTTKLKDALFEMTIF